MAEHADLVMGFPFALIIMFIAIMTPKTSFVFPPLVWDLITVSVCYVVVECLPLAPVGPCFPSTSLEGTFSRIFMRGVCFFYRTVLGWGRFGALFIVSALGASGEVVFDTCWGRLRLPTAVFGVNFFRGDSAGEL